MTPSYFSARVGQNRSLGRGAFVLTLDGCAALRDAQPGQFMMVRGEWGRDPLLPRAFSILRTHGPANERCDLLVKAVGRGTALLEHALVGAQLSVLGPLGVAFPAANKDETQLLVAGGVGLAPLLWYAERAAPTAMHLFYGARSAADLVLLEEIAKTGVTMHVATEDGSRGVSGRVTRALEEFFAAPASKARARVLTCGPNPMMRAVVEIARARRLDCLVSVEGEMACGIGVCLGCAVPNVGGERPFSYACVHGPVFDAARIVIP